MYSRSFGLSAGYNHNISASNYYKYSSNNYTKIRYRYRETANGNLNLLIGGGMLCMVLSVVFIVFYCSHRSYKKRTTSQNQRRWLDSDASLEVYTVDQMFDTQNDSSDQPIQQPGGNYVLQPPPSYDAVVAQDSRQDSVPVNSAFAFKEHIMQFNVNRNCCCQVQRQHPNYEIIKKCKQCRKQIREDYDDGDMGNNNEFCNCLLHHQEDDEYEDIPLPTPPQQPLLNGKQLYKPIKSDEFIENNNNPSTSATIMISHIEQNNMLEMEEEVEKKNDNNNNNVNTMKNDNSLNDIDKVNSNELVDSTGLPSYDTAAKLK